LTAEAPLASHLYAGQFSQFRPEADGSTSDGEPIRDVTSFEQRIDWQLSTSPGPHRFSSLDALAS